jgi:hypothetical protein
MINMKLKSYLCLGLLICTGAAQSAEVTFTMKVPKPTCNVTVTPNKNLGVLSRGTQTHPDIPVSVSCDGVVKNALTARPVTANVLQNDNIRLVVPMGNATSPGGPFLWLKSANKDVKLTGALNDAFCTVTGQSQTCNVTPVTEVGPNSAVGDGSVTIRFDMVYPA